MFIHTCANRLRAERWLVFVADMFSLGDNRVSHDFSFFSLSLWNHWLLIFFIFFLWPFMEMTHWPVLFCSFIVPAVSFIDATVWWICLKTGYLSSWKGTSDTAFQAAHFSGLRPLLQGCKCGHSVLTSMSNIVHLSHMACAWVIYTGWTCEQDDIYLSKRGQEMGHTTLSEPECLRGVWHCCICCALIDQIDSSSLIELSGVVVLYPEH